MHRTSKIHQWDDVWPKIGRLIFMDESLHNIFHMGVYPKKSSKKILDSKHFFFFHVSHLYSQSIKFRKKKKDPTRWSLYINMKWLWKLRKCKTGSCGRQKHLWSCAGLAAKMLISSLGMSGSVCRPSRPNLAWPEQLYHIPYAYSIFSWPACIEYLTPHRINWHMLKRVALRTLVQTSLFKESQPFVSTIPWRVESEVFNVLITHTNV